jgi:SAM-dependent methyltransferase
LPAAAPAGSARSGEREIVDSVAQYYADRLEVHGPTPNGVDWSSEDSQRARFAQLLELLDRSVSPECTAEPVSIIDYGCGYGALAHYLEQSRIKFTYTGFDVAPEMIAQAKALGHGENCEFTNDASKLEVADFTIASGIFNVKLSTPVGEWRDYIEATLDAIAELGARGFAFNMLSRFADPPLMREDLFYGDPMYYFMLCKERYSRNVALLHDYDLYEFTVLVRLGEPPKPLAP